jgi:tetratricopeptide (TPR) repeat protein
MRELKRGEMQIKLLQLSLVFLLTCHASLLQAQAPKTAEDYNNRGLEKQSHGDLDGAIEDYTKAVSLKAKPIITATAYNNRANARLSKNDFAGAIADYGKAIELQPDNYENYYNRGVALMDNNVLDIAIADFTKAIELAPSFALGYNNRGNAFSAKGQRGPLQILVESKRRLSSCLR